MLEGRRGGIEVDAGQRFVEPRADVAEHDVVARVGAVPLLPKRGGALLDPPAPARQVFLAGDAIGHVGAPVFQQRIQEVLRAQDAGVNVAVGLLDCRDQVADHARLVRRLDQALVERATERGLAAVAVKAGVGVVELRVERLLDAGGQLGVFARFGLIAQQAGGERHDLRVAVVIGGGGDVRRAFWSCRAPSRSGRCPRCRPWLCW